MHPIVTFAQVHTKGNIVAEREGGFVSFSSMTGSFQMYSLWTKPSLKTSFTDAVNSRKFQNPKLKKPHMKRKRSVSTTLRKFKLLVKEPSEQYVTPNLTCSVD